MDGARTGDGRETESCETDWALLGALSRETGVVLAASGVRRGRLRAAQSQHRLRSDDGGGRGTRAGRETGEGLGGKACRVGT